MENELLLQCQKVLEEEEMNVLQELERVQTLSNILREIEPEDRHSICQINGNNHQMAKKKLWEIKFAKERIKQGTFGICVGCDQEIPLERLLICPWTDFCITCKLARQKK